MRILIIGILFIIAFAVKGQVETEVGTTSLPSWIRLEKTGFFYNYSYVRSWKQVISPKEIYFVVIIRNNSVRFKLFYQRVGNTNIYEMLYYKRLRQTKD